MVLRCGNCYHKWVLDVDDNGWLHDNVDHAKKGIAIKKDVPALRTLTGKILLANKESFIQESGEVILDSTSRGKRRYNTPA